MALLKIMGMMDPHTHLRDLDWAHKATFASETAAAIAGGYTLVFDMPNTTPPTTSRDALDFKLNRLNHTAVCDWGVYFGADRNRNWRVFADIEADVCGLKIYNNQTTGDLLIDAQAPREDCYEFWSGKKPIAVHAEGETVLEILELVRFYRKATHFCHISTAQEIKYLQAAKEENLPVTIGVCPHHLFLTEDDLPTLGTFGLMKPELKTRQDRDTLWRAILDGVVDIVESDHAPHTIEEKESDQHYYGVPGLETTLPLLAKEVQAGVISVERMVELIATNPRKIWGIPQDEGTYTLVDMDAEYTIERVNLRSACGWSPFEGAEVCGKVREVWIRGQQVFDGEHILVSEGFGINAFN